MKWTLVIFSRCNTEVTVSIHETFNSALDEALYEARFDWDYMDEQDPETLELVFTKELESESYATTDRARYYIVEAEEVKPKE